MSLRAKVLALFGAFAVVPLLAIGVVDYVRSTRAVDTLVLGQTALIADRVAAELADRYATVQANIALVADNEETDALLAPAAERDTLARRRAVQPFFAELWTAIGRDFDWISIRDERGAGSPHEAYRLGAATPDDAPNAGSFVVTDSTAAESIRPRSVVAAVKLSSLLPTEALASRFGRDGYTSIVDRASRRVVYGAEHSDAIMAALPDSGAARSSLSYREQGSARLASVVRLTAPAWNVIATASVDEFGGPFAAIRAANLALVLLTATLAAIAFLILLWRSTRSLGMLTVAADAVGRGNLEPELPRAGRDEVGRLASAFHIMTRRVRETMADIERSRQMAAVGEFASQIAHEIRNPLTSIKLNMQKLERSARAGRMPGEAERPLEITLREIDRLDRVVHGVLQLGRARASSRAHVNLGRVVAQTADVARPQLERRGVQLQLRGVGEADGPEIHGDANLLSGALLNVMLNAGEASPAGGVVQVDLERNGAAARVRVRDSGPGIPLDQRARVFEPFYTTKASGTGLGLALAQRTVEEHGGTIRVEDVARGASFVIELPLVAPENRAHTV